MCQSLFTVIMAIITITNTVNIAKILTIIIILTTTAVVILKSTIVTNITAINLVIEVAMMVKVNWMVVTIDIHLLVITITLLLEQQNTATLTGITQYLIPAKLCIGKVPSFQLLTERLHVVVQNTITCHKDCSSA